MCIYALIFGLTLLTAADQDVLKQTVSSSKPAKRAKKYKQGM